MVEIGATRENPVLLKDFFYKYLTLTVASEHTHTSNHLYSNMVEVRTHNKLSMPYSPFRTNKQFYKAAQ